MVDFIAWNCEDLCVVGFISNVQKLQVAFATLLRLTIRFLLGAD